MRWHRLVASVTAALLLSGCGTLFGENKAPENTEAINAAAAINLCDTPDEMLSQLKPTSKEVATARAAIGAQLTLVDTWVTTPDTPKTSPNSSATSASARSGSQSSVTLQYVLEPTYTISKIYVTPRHGRGTKLTPQLGAGSSGEIYMNTTAYAEADPRSGLKPLITQVSVCVKPTGEK